MDIAVLRGKDLDEVGMMPTSEFFLWKTYLEIDRNRPSRSDYYAASIAREVRTVLMSKEKANQVKLEHMLIKFKGRPKKIPVAKPIEEASGDGISEDPHRHVPEEVKRRVIESKAKWFALLGIKDIKAEYGK